MERAAVKEFMHDSPAPVQNRNDTANLIKRFWNKLVSYTNALDITAEPVVETETPTPAVVEKTPATHEGQQNRNRNNRRGNGKNKPTQEQYQQNQQNQTQQPVNPSPQHQEPRPNRQPRGPGRNVRPNLAPVVAVVEAEVNNETLVAPVMAKPEPELTTELVLVTDTDNDAVISTEEQAPRPERKSNSRRGPNRRRPRNPNYKKPESDHDTLAQHGEEAAYIPNEVSDSNGSDEPRPAKVRSYNREFAERIEKSERVETPAPVTTPNPVEHHAPVVIAESAPKVVDAPQDDTRPQDSNSES
jgi:ribonuclease E